MDYRENVEIDLIDLFHDVLRKWRKMIIFMVIGALVMGIVSYFKPMGSDGDKRIKDTVITRKELTDMRDVLDDKKAEEVLLAVDSYLKNESVIPYFLFD